MHLASIWILDFSTLVSLCKHTPVWNYPSSLSELPRLVDVYFSTLKGFFFFANEYINVLWDLSCVFDIKRIWEEMLGFTWFKNPKTFFWSRKLVLGFKGLLALLCCLFYNIREFDSFLHRRWATFSCVLIFKFRAWHYVDQVLLFLDRIGTKDDRNTAKTRPGTGNVYYPFVFEQSWPTLSQDRRAVIMSMGIVFSGFLYLFVYFVSVSIFLFCHRQFTF